jgi:hypothetical protein
MSTKIHQDFHSDIANSVLQDIQFQQSNYYYFLGKVDTWGAGDTPSNVVVPESEFESTSIRSNILYINKIGPNDVSAVVRRVNWESGLVFEPYDHSKDMSNKQFYCVTDDNNVYKCLDSGSGAVSTSKPTSTSFYAFRTSDGYLWKYMYNVPAFKRTRFMSLNYMPVQRALSDGFYSKGAVETVSVTDSGSGYSDSLLTHIDVGLSAVGSGAVGTILVGGIGNIIDVTLTSGGSGYTAGVKISFVSVAGIGGAGTATIVGGVITDIVIDTPGVGYVSGETINFSVGGGIVVPLVSKETGSITGAKIVDAGIGYATAPTLTVITSEVGYSGKYGNATALLSCVVYEGKIVNVNIVDPGINYTSGMVTSIVVQGNGTGAKFTPVIYDGKVVDVVIENAGSGYTEMVLSVVGTGTGAVLRPIISSSDFISTQSIIEQTAIAGALYSVQVTNGGNNYSSSTMVNIIGDGTGAVATPVIENGVVKYVIVSAFGVGYTYANVTITDTNRSSFGNNIDATAYATLSPIGGHGYDAVSELFGGTLGITSSLRQDAVLNTIGQDYRQFGIIKNPTDILTSKRHTNATSIIAYMVVFADVVDLVIDEILVQNDVKFRVVAINDLVVTLQQLGIKYIDPIGILSAQTEDTRQYSSTKILSYPVVNKYSGKLLYTANENPFSMSEDQGVTIKTFLQF